jgi:hypothetical protein
VRDTSIDHTTDSIRLPHDPYKCFFFFSLFFFIFRSWCLRSFALHTPSIDLLPSAALASWLSARIKNAQHMLVLLENTNCLTLALLLPMLLAVGATLASARLVRHVRSLKVRMCLRGGQGTKC